MRKLSAVLTKSGAFLLGSTILCTSGTALAQQTNTNDDRDIVVTASKREENLQDVPLAITAIGTERLDELQVKEFQDVVKFLPSVTIQTLAPGFSQVYFRGVASGENANHSTSLPTVGTYLDEMPITTIQGALDIHAYDLARVEALAGPQGTLYGASSMAGTIKLVTNKPDTSGTYGSVGLELNSVTRGGIGGVAEGFINARISDRAALRLVGWYRHDAGYIDNIAGTRVYPISQNTDTDGDGENDTVINLPGDDITQNNADLVEKDYNTVDTYGARLALGIELDDDWTIRPTLMGQIQKANGSFAQERSSAVTRSLQTVQYNPERSDDKWIQAALTIEGKIGNWDLTVTGGHLRRKTLTDSDIRIMPISTTRCSARRSIFTTTPATRSARTNISRASTAIAAISAKSASPRPPTRASASSAGCSTSASRTISSSIISSTICPTICRCRAPSTISG